MDLFTVPTLRFSVLYCFFVIAHDRRCILHFNVTRHPNSVWIAQQLREAFPDDHPHKYVIFDRDAKFGIEVLAAAQQLSWHLSELPSEALGKTGWQNAGSEVAGATCSIM